MNHGRRNQDAQRTASSQRGRGQRTGITRALELRQGHLAHGGSRGQRRAADGTETGASADGCHGHTALAVAHPGFSRLEQRLRQAAERGKLPHQQEQRDHRQVVVGERAVGDLLELVEDGCVRAVDEVRPHQAADRHGQANGHANENQSQQDRKGPGGEFNTSHVNVLRWIQPSSLAGTWPGQTGSGSWRCTTGNR